MSKVVVLFISLVLVSVSAQASERIAVVGSTTVLPIISQAAGVYKKTHPNVVITVSGGGSGVGVASIIQGTAEIGMASRQVTEQEKIKLGKKVQDIVVAADAVAMAISKKVYESGVRALSLKQIAAIYRGKIRNWKDVGGMDSKIVVIDKEASRGTRHVFAKAVLGDKHARAAGASIVSGSNNEEQGIISRSDKAIGMLSNAWLNDQVRGLDIIVNGKAVSPSIERVRDGSYPLARELRVLVPQTASAATRDFVKFLLSKKGQEIVKNVGYLPLK
ncbi:MAG: phosphate ABC transporter substrate-binding protein PstS family protein [Mariprofundaceae bacterium]